jgi:hypothetical protein
MTSALLKWPMAWAMLRMLISTAEDPNIGSKFSVSLADA